jgi:hypothetical protein
MLGKDVARAVDYLLSMLVNYSARTMLNVTLIWNPSRLPRLFDISTLRKPPAMLRGDTHAEAHYDVFHHQTCVAAAVVEDPFRTCYS